MVRKRSRGKSCTAIGRGNGRGKVRALGSVESSRGESPPRGEDTTNRGESPSLEDTTNSGESPPREDTSKEQSSVGGLGEDTTGDRGESPPLAASRPCRPSKCSLGIDCIVKSNHFKVTFNPQTIYEYNVNIKSMNTSTPVRSFLKRVVLKKLVDRYKSSELGDQLLVYDGAHLVYTAGPLPFQSKKLTVSFGDKNAKFLVTIKELQCLDMSALKSFLDGSNSNLPMKEMNVLNFILNESAFTNPANFEIGRVVFAPAVASEPFGVGLQICKGFLRTVRPTQLGLTVNLDVRSSLFLAPLPVIEFVKEILNKDNDEPLSNIEYTKVRNALIGVQIYVTHRQNVKSRYRISDVTIEGAGGLKFRKTNDGKMTSISEFFMEKYNHVINHPNWPCLQVGNLARPTYLPMEVCTIVRGQKCSKLNTDQLKLFEVAGRVDPKSREQYITEMACANTYHDHSYMRRFGLKIDDELSLIKAHILPAPVLTYGKYADNDTKGQKLEDNTCQPEMGQWDIKNKKLLNAGEVKRWVCLNLSSAVREPDAITFCAGLVNTCRDLGMVFKPEPMQRNLLKPNQSIHKFKSISISNISKDLRRKGGELQLVIVILDDNDGGYNYNQVKHLCVTDIGVVSQCCKAHKVNMSSSQYLSALAQKINVKMGGRNFILSDQVLEHKIFGDIPTIIFGADVTHPHPSRGGQSIAAVVASRDWPKLVKYSSLISVQEANTEIIGEMFRMVRSHLCSFMDENGGLKPERIICYRDGVGESQFDQVSNIELRAIHDACESIQSGYNPPITFVVVQKRHRTRFFPLDDNPNEYKNVSPGTLIDTQVCHPSEFDFYLCSHATIKGTSRPTHYHVLHDGNKFSADTLQLLTNSLCYMLGNSSSAISIVVPVYYADRAAYHARCYMRGPESTVKPELAPLMFFV